MNTAIEKFYQVWIEVCEENKIKLNNAWNNNAQYTDLVLKNKNSITMQISKKLKMKIHYEYYSIDAVFFNNEDLVLEKAKNNTWQNIDGEWLTSFRIALEHENYVYGEKGAYQEICHLLTVSSELKVLVTYQDEINVKNIAYDLNSAIPNNSYDKQSILLITGSKENGEIVWNGFILCGSRGIKEII